MIRTTTGNSPLEFIETSRYTKPVQRSVIILCSVFALACGSSESNDSSAVQGNSAQDNGTQHSATDRAIAPEHLSVRAAKRPPKAGNPTIIPAFAKPNIIEIFAQPERSHQTLVAGTFEMKSAYVGWYGNRLFLVLARHAAGCDMFGPARLHGPKFTQQVKLSLALTRLGDEQQAGNKRLARTTIQVSDVVILAKGFNRIITDTKANGLRFDSGVLKADELVTGSFYIHENDRNEPKQTYKGAMIKGSFKAAICNKRRAD